MLRGLADLAYPRVCPLCGGSSRREGRHICWDCAASLERFAIRGTPCRVCGAEIDPRLIDGLCASCRRSRPRYDMARSAFVHDGDARRLVHDFKYRLQTWLADDLCDFLEGCARASFDLREVDAVLPIPLHPVKFVARTYNQSALLAATLTRRIGAPCRPGLLKRVGDTSTQTHLGARGRRANVAGAFAAPFPEETRSRTLLVVDDVMTTGATLDEAAKTLKGAGAWRVWGLTICRAEHNAPGNRQ